jgi:hypothetical protein
MKIYCGETTGERERERDGKNTKQRDAKYTKHRWKQWEFNMM